MRFDAVLGHEQPKSLMSNVLQGNRIGHAYLFSGPDGVGKTRFAIEVAKALLCRKEGAPHESDCADCRTIDQNNHPDFFIVQAEEEKRYIVIDQARAMGQALSLRPVQSPRRVAIIREADRMNEQTANAFLKTLEEPPAYTALILTSARSRSLLDTIRSRCQEMRFGPLSPDHIREILTRHGGFSDEEIVFASRLSEGSAGQAIWAIESGCIKLHLDVLGRVLALPKEDPFALAGDILGWLKNVSRTLEPQRQRLRELLRLLTCAYRDVLLLGSGGDMEEMFHAGRPDLLQPAAGNLSPLAANRIIESLWNARKQTDANASMNLVLEELMIRLAQLQRAT